MSGAYRIVENARLDARNTFGVRATAPMLVEVADAAALPELFGYAMLRDGPVLVLGGGSNLLFAGDPPGATLALTAQRIEMLEDDGTGAIVRADAGVVWHDFVLWTLGHGLCGLENLALIPGTVGAAPIQNIGAYGVEVRERIHAVEAFDRKSGGFVRFAAGECEFAYRDSLFKRDPEHYIVVAVEFALSRTPALKLEYAGIGEELQAMGVDAAPRASQVAEAVIRIRRRKLPDPAVLGNAGSFFKNPVVTAEQCRDIINREPNIVHYEMPDGTIKLAAGWLIDACGWRGKSMGNAGVYEKQALVLVNRFGETGIRATGGEVMTLAGAIQASVYERFGIRLEPEPVVV